MKLFEEFRLYEDMWDEYPSKDVEQKRLNAVNSQNSFKTEDWIWQIRRVAKLSGPAREAAEIQIFKNRMRYHHTGVIPEGGIGYERQQELLAGIEHIAAGNISSIEVTKAGEPYEETHYGHYYDLTDEADLVRYIDYYFTRYNHSRACLETWIAALIFCRFSIVIDLASRGLFKFAEKANDRMKKYIDDKLAKVELKSSDTETKPSVEPPKPPSSDLKPSEPPKPPEHTIKSIDLKSKRLDNNLYIVYDETKVSDKDFEVRLYSPDGRYLFTLDSIKEASEFASVYGARFK